MDLGLDTRKEILARALMMESLSSIFIAGLLGIKDRQNSKTLGNKSSSLSFNQKIDLLLDLGALNSDEKKKCQAFMEIRNQFMHNLEAASFQECFSFLSGADKKVLKLYPQPQNISVEKQLRNASLKLADDVLSFISKLMDNVKLKITQDAKADTAIKSNEAFVKSITQAKAILDDYIEQQIIKDPTLSSKKLKGMGTYVSKLIYSLWHKNFGELTAK